MNNSILNGYKIAMDDLKTVLYDPDTIDGVICMDKKHRLMFDIDYLNDKIMEYMERQFKQYFISLADKESTDEN